MSRFEYGCQSEVICNDDNIFPAMKTLIEDEEMGVREAARFVEKDSDSKVTEDRARKVYYMRTKGGARAPLKLKPIVEILISSFSKSIDLIDEVIRLGPGGLSANDQKMMDNEFKFIMPMVLLAFDKMGVDVVEMIDNIKPRLTKRREHVEDAKNNGRAEIQD